MDLLSQLGIDAKDETIRSSIDMHRNRSELLDRLVHIRKLHKLSQQDVADELGITRQAVSKFEQRNHDPRISTIIGYALAVGAHIDVRVTAVEARCHEDDVTDRESD